MSAKRGVTFISQVASYLDDRRDQVVSIDDLAQLLPEVPRNSIQRSMLQLAGNFEMEVISQGRAWIIHGPKARSEAASVKRAQARARQARVPEAPSSVKSEGSLVGSYYECIGITRRGIMLRAEDGQIWAAEKV